jgi:hypothetical protein
MRFMLIHYINEALLRFDEDGNEIEDPDEERALDAWDDEMKARGILVGGGRLRPVAETITIQARGGGVLKTDGPFAETKEQIAGYCVLECANVDEAVEVSSRHPTASIGTFELRPYKAD